MLSMTEKDFVKLTSFIKSNYGINLTQKRELITGRLTTMVTQKGYASFADYVDVIVTQRNSTDIEEMLNLLTTNYSYFMRETAHFDYFRDVVLPWLEKTKTNKNLSIWCAGCATGQEPYTLSMYLKDHFGKKPGWDTRILATDISNRAMSTAVKAEYSKDSLSDMPQEFLSKYFTKTSAGNMYKVAEDIRKNVIFKTFNLMDPITFKMNFDVIFCRNVMIYFDSQTKDALASRFYNATNPGGYLFIGHSESITDSGSRYKYISPAVYRK